MAQAGYPWTLELEVEYTLGPDGLTVTVSAANLSDSPAPFAAGMHPYLAPATGVDAAVLHVPARERMVVDDRLLPTHTVAVDGAHDFGEPRAIGELVLDDAYTGLRRDEHGVARCRLDRTELWMDQRWRWVQVFTGDTPAEPERRRSVAVEPMTAPADAFNSGRDLVVLAPEETWSGRFGISARPESS